jgi:flagellin-specific chaperone FliS
MKRLLVILLLTTGLFVPLQKAHAQFVIAEIIKAGVKKVIKAVDLQVQRQQNKVVWLQNAQKVLENTMSKLKLEEISDWTERQRSLYKNYFDELNQVKSIIAYYRKVKDVTEKQVLLVRAYKKAWNLFRQDQHFTTGELNYMQQVYSGILDESVRNLDQLYIVVNSFQTQMSDAQRLELIDAVSAKVDGNYTDLQTFNRGNIQLSMQRAKSLQEIEGVKKLYGLE